jgi:hypothetical protein
MTEQVVVEKERQESAQTVNDLMTGRSQRQVGILHSEPFYGLNATIGRSWSVSTIEGRRKNCIEKADGLICRERRLRVWRRFRVAWLKFMLR